MHRHHEDFGKRDKTIHCTYHPILDGKWTSFSATNMLTYPAVAGTPCDVDGFDITPGALPQNENDSQPSWFPFRSQVQFEMADFLFKKVEMSQADVNTLMRLWATTSSDGHAPFSNHRDMLATIDAIHLRDIPWKNFSANYSGDVPPANPPDWMLKEYTVYFRDPLCII